MDTNDWCITGRTILSLPGDSITYLISFKTRFELADAVRAITDRQASKNPLVRSYLRVPQAAGQEKLWMISNVN